MTRIEFDKMYFKNWDTFNKCLNKGQINLLRNYEMIVVRKNYDELLEVNTDMGCPIPVFVAPGHIYLSLDAEKMARVRKNYMECSGGRLY